MSDLIDKTDPGANAPEFTVSEISGVVKRLIEGEFSHVRIRGEVGRVSRPQSGHVYLDLKDDRATIAAVMWKGTVARLRTPVEEGMEAVATGRLTTFPGQSKYQLIIEAIAPAGMGALMAMLEKRKQALAAEGLFDQSRKLQIPYLPDVIGVITSPSGAVIRDILHRLRDRFPRYVLLWPVVVQGEKCAPEISAAIEGFNALQADSPVPRPDLLIVARGGGSVEDLWGFNEEAVVRAAANSEIPLISAVGHETDTTLIDYAADQRAPTPTAAAELAVPVRSELVAWLADIENRRVRALMQGVSQRSQRLRDMSRALPNLSDIVALQGQRLDMLSTRLPHVLQSLVQSKRTRLVEKTSIIHLKSLRQLIEQKKQHLGYVTNRFGQTTTRQVERWRDKLDSLERLRETLGYTATLDRGYAVVRDGEGGLVSSMKAAKQAKSLNIQFKDGHFTTSASKSQKRTQQPIKKTSNNQGSLF